MFCCLGNVFKECPSVEALNFVMFFGASKLFGICRLCNAFLNSNKSLYRMYFNFFSRF